GSRILKYSIEMHHKGLNEHKLISAPEIDILQNKADLQASKWNDKWEKLETKRLAKEEKEANLEEADRRANEVSEAIQRVETLLLHTLSVDDTVDWESIKKHNDFEEPKPKETTKERYRKIPPQPDKTSSEFAPKFSVLDKLIRSRKERKISESEAKFESATREWTTSKNDIENQNAEMDRRFKEAQKKWEVNVMDWEKRKATFYEKQRAYNEKIDGLKELYFKKDADAIVEYCDIVLNNSEYPDLFPKNFEIEYNVESQILIVEYQLPSLEHLPTIKEVKYVASKKELMESVIPESQRNKMYDGAIYQIALRTIHELLEADAADAVSAVSFNGWVNAINKGTGIEENKCILSVQAKKDEFQLIQLANVDPRICFRNLKGVASSKLSTLTPIQPILQMSKTDKRFIEGYAVADSLDGAVNVAAMDWEDFEHLIREIFEKEFMVNGGEVRVTQASRDGGVDAIAFDPDPIRGGKIVIQAKRYTNTVGVSAVRDLYGTVVNEGATKGILVTTADYGPDVYEFARAKPLTLLSGSNLLHLLEKHGYHAKIDLKEAKRTLADEK
ncbi:MAG: restriction endonuclease, partial [Candidatus Zixiibacteriota bacterium]